MISLELQILMLERRIKVLAARGSHNAAIVKHNERRLRNLLNKQNQFPM